jgi:hypothetical protein
MVSVCIRLLFLSLSNAFIASGKYCRHHTTLVIASSSPSALAIFMRALSLSLMVFYHLPLLHLFSCHYHDRAYPLTFGPWPPLSSEFLQKSRPVPYRWRSAKHTTMVALPRLDAMRFSRLLAIGRPIPIRYQSSPEIHIRTPTGLPYFSAKYATEMIKRNAFTIKSASRPIDHPLSPRLCFFLLHTQIVLFPQVSDDALIIIVVSRRSWVYSSLAQKQYP